MNWFSWLDATFISTGDDLISILDNGGMMNQPLFCSGYVPLSIVTKIYDDDDGIDCNVVA